MSQAKVDDQDFGAKGSFDELKRRAAGLESTVGAHIEEAERIAEARAAEIIADAERQAQVIRDDADREATRTRDEADREAKGVRDKADRDAEGVREESQALVERSREQVNELMRLRQALFASLRDTLNDFESAIAHAEENRSFTEAEALAPPPEPVEEPEEAMAEEVVEKAPEPAAPAGGSVAGAPAAAMVLVRVEPIRDLQTARGVERAFSSLPLVRSVSLRSFEDRTALIETSGLDVNALLGSMRRHLSVPFILRDAGPGRLVVQVGEVPGLGGS